ncbi:MAG: MBOAT family protein, partial [Prevotellaceae bacterium]|nr:MBOAT family protein [Prevotellaceae bacterium]
MSIIGMLENIFTYSDDTAIIFTRLSFWIFFAVLLFGYSFVYKKTHVSRSFYLLLFSIFFYYKSSGTYFALLLFSTALDFFLAKGIFKIERQFWRKFLVVISVVANLSVLIYFKYSYFFVGILNSWLGTDFAVVNIFSEISNIISGAEKFDAGALILPVGISFYTFQVLSYTIDVYRRKITPLNNIIDFGFYVSFFPSLVAGPIVRASDFVPQIYKPYSVTRREMWLAVFFILSGLVKKVIVSDYISLNFVDRVFDDPTLYSGFELLMGVYGYAIQIYCDFSGYTDIAIGVALLVGFRLPPNFNSPYKARSVQDFWHRWHISLSTWLRDYLYISLGGNRKGKIRTYVNLLITMLLGGLWHGASYKFIVWGGMHGLALAANRFWKERKLERQHAKSDLRKENYLSRVRQRMLNLLSIILTFHFVCLAWIFFRAGSMSIALDLIGRIFSQF